nr:hypothetical protein [Tanacetum cinerariifolium]
MVEIDMYLLGALLDCAYIHGGFVIMVAEKSPMFWQAITSLCLQPHRATAWNVHSMAANTTGMHYQTSFREKYMPYALTEITSSSNPLLNICPSGTELYGASPSQEHKQMKSEGDIASKMEWTFA